MKVAPIVAELGVCPEYTITLKNSIEEIVLKWSNIIEEVVQDNPFRLFQEMDSPQPEEEIKFWNGRMKNLENIYQQLCDPYVKSIASILENTESAYIATFRTSFRYVVESLHEAKDITLYLVPLAQKIDEFLFNDFEESKPSIKAIMHTMCLVWSHSKYYCSNDRMVHMFKLIHNMFMEQAKISVDAGSIFQCDVVEAENKINIILETLDYYR